MPRKPNIWQESDRWERGAPLDGEVPRWDASKGMWIYGPPGGIPAAGGSGLYHADYIIDAAYTGTDGTSFTTATGSTAKAYSTIAAAVTDANTNRQGSNQSSTFFIVGGSYTVSSAMTVTPPSTGSYIFIGEGRDRVRITLTAGITQSTVSSGGSFVWRDLTFNTTSAITILDCGDPNETYLHLIRFIVNNSSAIGVDPGGLASVQGTFMSQCSTEGSGTGVSGGFLHTSDCFFGSAIGVKPGVAEIDIVGGRMACSTVGVDLSSANVTKIGVSGVMSVGPLFRVTAATSPIFRSITLANNTVVLSSTEVGIDFSGAGTSGANIDGVSITGNTFNGGASTVGIKGHASAGPQQAVVTGNSFYGFTAGNEITNMARASDGNSVWANPSDAGHIANTLYGALAITGVISPAALGTTENNYNPSGMAQVTRLRLTPNAAGTTLTGLAGGAEGRVVIIHNVGSSGNITIPNQDGGSDANKQFSMATAQLTLASDQSTLFIYESASGFWHLMTDFLNDHQHTGSGDGGNNLQPGIFFFPSAASPSQTVDAQAVWDSDDDLLTVGTGSGRNTFYPGVNERALALGIAGSIPVATSQFADFAVLAPHAGTLLRMKASVKTAVSVDKTIRLRKATSGGGYTDWADVTGFVLTLSSGTNGGYVATVDPSNVAFSEGDLFQLETEDANAASGTNLVVEVIYNPS